MHEVQRVRPVTTEWRIMSLAYLNLVQHEGKVSEDRLRKMQKAWGPIRVCAAAAAAHGDGVLGDLYTAMGTRFHVEGRREDPNAIPEALAAVGLEETLSKAQDSSEFDEQIKTSHLAAFDEVGLDVGTPVLRVREHAFFGPVMTPAPRGEAAGRLWDGFVLIADAGCVYEIKRTRDQNPTFG